MYVYLGIYVYVSLYIYVYMSMYVGIGVYVYGCFCMYCTVLLTFFAQIQHHT